jgi:hypothetical protein
MTVTTEEAEELAKGAFILMDDPPDPDDEIMLGSDFLADLATALRSLAAERDALQAENARLREALRKIRNKARTGRPPFMSTRVDYFQIASAAQEGKKDE